MRIPEYLSPSSISLYKNDPQQFYLRYLANNRPGRDPQTKPMAVGSAFDAFVKAYLYENLIGKNNHNKDHDDRFELTNLFNAQVEEPLREWAWQNGKYVFEQYKQSGVLGDLMIMLRESPSEPRFEFEIRGVKHGYRQGKEGQFGEVVLLGKPDVDFIAGEGAHVILDFKVNGYCSNSLTSPKPGYLRMRSAGKTLHGQHKRCRQQKWLGVDINSGMYLEEVDADWARQLAIYGWLCGESVGSNFITIIHQIVCSPNPGGLPGIKIAEHHCHIHKDFQQKIFDECVELWDLVHSDHFFKDMTKEQSDSLCQLLEGRANIINHPMYNLCK